MHAELTVRLFVAVWKVRLNQTSPAGHRRRSSWIMLYHILYADAISKWVRAGRHPDPTSSPHVYEIPMLNRKSCVFLSQRACARARMSEQRVHWVDLYVQVPLIAREAACLEVHTRCSNYRQRLVNRLTLFSPSKNGCQAVLQNSIETGWHPVTFQPITHRESPESCHGAHPLFFKWIYL